MIKKIIISVLILFVISGCSPKKENVNFLKANIEVFKESKEVVEVAEKILNEKSLKFEGDALHNVLQKLMIIHEVDIEYAGLVDDVDSYVVEVTSLDISKYIDQAKNKASLRESEILFEEAPEVITSILIKGSDLTEESKEDYTNAILGDVKSYSFNNTGLEEQSENQTVSKDMFEKTPNVLSGTTVSSIENPIPLGVAANYKSTKSSFEIAVTSSKSSQQINEKISKLSSFNQSLKPGYDYIEVKVKFKEVETPTKLNFSYTDFRFVEKETLYPYPSIKIFGVEDSITIDNKSGAQTLILYGSIKQNSKGTLLTFRDFDNNFLIFDLDKK